MPINSHMIAGGPAIVIERPMKDSTEAIGLMLDALTNRETGAIESLNEIDAVGTA